MIYGVFSVFQWNNHGYDVAKLFANKLDWVSPVWLRITPTAERSYSLVGVHDVDAGWIEEVKRKGDKTKIIPRLLLENWKPEDFVRLFRDRDRQKTFLDVIIQALNVSLSQSNAFFFCKLFSHHTFL